MDPDRPSDPRLLCVGRVNLDLYVEELGVPVAGATTFVSSVGGSPTNIAIIAQTWGVPTVLFSAEGADPAGALVRARLDDLGVDTRWLQAIDAGSTSLALLSTLEPDRGERQFYREHPADALLTADLVPGLPWDSLEAVLLSGDSMAMGTTPAAVGEVSREAIARGIDVWWDLDLRATSWATSSDYAAQVAPALAKASVVIGTEEEFTTLLGLDASADLIPAVRSLDAPTLVLKLGPEGALVMRQDEPDLRVPAQATAPISTVGAGDTAAGALLAARLRGMSWEASLEISMQAAAWTVEQPYCSSGFPRPEQLGVDLRQQVSSS